MLARWIAYGCLVAGTSISPHALGADGKLSPPSDSAKLQSEFTIDERFVHIAVANPTDQAIGYARGPGSQLRVCIRIRKDDVVLAWSEQGNCYSNLFFSNRAVFSNRAAPTDAAEMGQILPGEALEWTLPMSELMPPDTIVISGSSAQSTSACGSACDVQVELSMCTEVTVRDCRTFTSDWTFVMNLNVVDTPAAFSLPRTSSDRDIWQPLQQSLPKRSPPVTPQR